MFAESTSDIFNDLFRTFHHTKLYEHRTNLPGRCLFEEMAASVGHVTRTDGVRQVTTREFQTPNKPDFVILNAFLIKITDYFCLIKYLIVNFTDK